jgi:colanic acid/amylovoran biosynthesis glycosyltransferase
MPAVSGADNGFAAPRIAYLTSRYPAVSHSFIQREVLALRELGAEVATLSIHPPLAADLFTREDRKEAAGTFSIRSAPWWKVAAAHLCALLGHPRAYLATLRFSAGQGAAGGRPLTPIFHFAEAVVVWRECRRREIPHVHAHFTSPSADVAHLAARLGEAISPGSLSWSFTAHGTDILGDHPARLAEKVRSAPLVVCVGDFGRAQLMRLVDEEHWRKIRVIHCGLDSRWRAAPAPAHPPRGEAGEDGALRILAVGRLEREKGHAILLEAVAELYAEGVEVVLEVVGGGSARERLIARARQLGIEAQVSFSGKAGQDTIRERYAEADLFCLPSLGEGVPVVLMEAMAMAVPVVATRVGGVPELIEDGVSGRLVSPGSSTALARAIAALAADPPLRGRMGVAGRQRVLGAYSVEPAASSLFGEFSSLARRQGEKPTAAPGRAGDGAGASASAGFRH